MRGSFKTLRQEPDVGKSGMKFHELFWTEEARWWPGELGRRMEGAFWTRISCYLPTRETSIKSISPTNLLLPCDIEDSLKISWLIRSYNSIETLSVTSDAKPALCKLCVTTLICSHRQPAFKPLRFTPRDTPHRSCGPPSGQIYIALSHPVHRLQGRQMVTRSCLRCMACFVIVGH